MPIEPSRFSPETPPATSRDQSTWTNTMTAKHSSRDLEAATMPSPRLRDRFTKFFFDVRTMGHDREPELVPIQQPELREWPPLHIEKRPQLCCAHCVRRRKRRKRDRILIAILIILLLYLLGNVIALNVRSFPTGSTTVQSTSSGSAAGLSADQQLCVSEYNINAAANASTYPCSTCFPVLQSIPSSISSTSSETAQQISNALQFCALNSVFNEMDQAGQSALTTGGWVQNVQFCSWSGVQCDGSGRVSSLKLSFPSVPAVIPGQIDGLTMLQTLQLVGNNAVPAGSLPSSFSNLTELSSFELESTAITAFPNALFSSLKNITSLTLVKNAHMGNALPSSLTSTSLQSLVVTNQALSNPLVVLANSTSLRSSLTLLDLSATNLTGTIPSSISSFSSLVELHLEDNDLANPLPSAFPPKLQILTLANNTQLSGTVTGSFCSLSELQDCDMTGTQLRAAGSCSVCQFSA